MLTTKSQSKHNTTSPGLNASYIHTFTFMPNTSLSFIYLFFLFLLGLSND